MKMRGKTVLLFNPWIYDFAAYDFWSKPIGLLYLGGLLRKLGYDVHLIDCLDRHHPAVAEISAPSDRANASGKFLRQEIDKPAVLRHVPRRFCRYGMPPAVVAELLQAMPPPDVILVTSVLTYWYLGVHDAVRMLRDVFPQAYIMLGGIYATLCSDHARAVIRPDELIAGEGEIATVRRLAQLTGGPPDFDYYHLDDLPFPAYDLYPKLTSVSLLTSRGCPNSCSFCASKTLAGRYRRRSPQNVLAEFDRWRRAGVRHFAFFDDALLHRPDDFIKPILRGIIERGSDFHLHTPNGLTPRFIDAELARLFRQAGGETLRLSFETADPARQRSMSAKVTNDELGRALQHLEDAGYARSEIGVYVLMGLPGQPPEEFRQSALYVHRLGARVYPASFSPIPQTLEWRRAVMGGLWDESADLLLTNTTLFPIWAQLYGYDFCAELLQWAGELNRGLTGAAAVGQQPQENPSPQSNLCDIPESFIS